MKKVLTGVVVAGMMAVSGAVSAETWQGVIEAHAIDTTTWSRKGTEYPATPVNVFVDFEKCRLIIDGNEVKDTFCLYKDFVMGVQKWRDPEAGAGKGTISISTYSVSKRTKQIEYTESNTSGFVVRAKAGIEKINRYTMPEYNG